MNWNGVSIHILDVITDPAKNFLAFFAVSEENNVRFYWIPADALPKVLTLGSDPPEPPPEFYII